MPRQAAKEGSHRLFSTIPLSTQYQTKKHRELHNSQDYRMQLEQCDHIFIHNLSDLGYPEFQLAPAQKLTQSSYPYTQQLLALEACRPAIPRQLPALTDAVTSPLLLDNWRQALWNHPDKLLVRYILEGLAGGFQIGMNPNQQCISA